jgi:uncharacterized protein YciI
MHYLLIYTTAADYVTRRAEFRQEHLALAWRAAGEGKLVLGGAVGDPPDSSLLLWNCDSPDTPAAFAKVDPYVLNGLVTKWEVKPWNTVVGELATRPLRP